MDALHIDVEADLGALRLRVKLPPASGTTVIIGPNGAGKSTLLMGLLGAIKLSRGEIRLGDTPLFSSEQRVHVPVEHRRLGYLPQRYALFPNMSVIGNVAFGIRGCSKAERGERARALLDDLGVGHLAGRAVGSLSGGEAQRVALARALAIEPRALLLDEPMAALDAGARRKVREFLGERLGSIEIPTVVVSHDVADVHALADRVAVIEAGRIVQAGTVAEVEASPVSSFVEQFLGGKGDAGD